MLIELIVVALASYRISRMVAYERGAFDCFHKFQEFVKARAEGSWIEYGFKCPLCIGFWMCFVFVVLPTWIVVPIAASGLQVLIQKIDWYIKYQNEVAWSERDLLKLGNSLNDRN